jgi:MSHA pilin protein MshD
MARRDHDRASAFVRTPRRGVGMVEAAVATVIVGVMLVAAMTTVEASLRMGNATAEGSHASAFGALLMSEILRARYEEPVDPVGFGVEAPETGASRAKWDDVDDYDGFQQLSPTDVSGAEVDGAKNWTWKAAVTRVDPADPSRVVGVETGLKRITVTIVDPGGATTTCVALRSRFGARDRTVTSPTSFVGHVRVHLEVGGGFKGNVTSGSALVNEPAP